jgi:hypothetical protein
MFGAQQKSNPRSGIENRLSPRRNTMIEAQIVYEGGRRRMDCIIRNLSETGAKIEVPTVIGMPNNFELVAPRYRPHGCRIVWRALREIGVEFTS